MGQGQSEPEEDEIPSPEELAEQKAREATHATNLPLAKAHVEKKDLHALVSMLSAGEISAADTFDDMPLKDYAYKKRFLRGMEAAIIYELVEMRHPSRWSDTWFLNWFMYCVPEIDSLKHPELFAVLKEFEKRLSWAMLEEGKTLKDSFANASVPQASVDLFFAEVDRMGKHAETVAAMAAKGNLMAMRRMGESTRHQLDATKFDENKQAFVWYSRAARAGCTESMYEVGRMYFYGEGVAQDDERSLKWYRKAAALGHMPSTYAVESFTKYRHQAPSDPVERMKYYAAKMDFSIGRLAR